MRQSCPVTCASLGRTCTVLPHISSCLIDHPLFWTSSHSVTSLLAYCVWHALSERLLPRSYCCRCGVCVTAHNSERCYRLCNDIGRQRLPPVVPEMRILEKRGHDRDAHPCLSMKCVPHQCKMWVGKCGYLALATLHFVIIEWTFVQDSLGLRLYPQNGVATLGGGTTEWESSNTKITV